MKLHATINDRTYGVELPWWLLAAGLVVALLWQPATAWASDRFDDVPDSNIFHDDIDWMADTGVTAGCGGGDFCPKDDVTREQMAAFMRRLETEGVFMRADEVQAELAALEQQLKALQSDNAALQTLLAGVSRNGDLLTFAGMNVQVVDGTGDTDGAVNGLGNLIVGYNESRYSYARGGSHNLVVGPDHGYSSYGGFVAGSRNQIVAPFASVSGGRFNKASNWHSSVSGGFENEASGLSSSVTGGSNNFAHGDESSVSGGFNRSVSDSYDWRAGSLFENN